MICSYSHRLLTHTPSFLCKQITMAHIHLWRSCNYNIRSGGQGLSMQYINTVHMVEGTLNKSDIPGVSLNGKSPP